MIGKPTANATPLFALAAAILLVSSCVSAEEGTEASIKKKLTTKVTFKFVDKKLEDAVDFIAKAAKVTITIDPKAPTDTAPSISLAVTDMNCGVALQWILKLAELDYVVGQNGIFVAKPEVIAPEKKKKGAEPGTAPKAPEKKPVSSAAGAKNSFLKAKVGDWTEYTYRWICKEDPDGSDIAYIKHTIQSVSEDKIVVAIDWSKPELNWNRQETRELNTDRFFIGTVRQKDELLWGHVAKFPSDTETEGDETIVVGNKSYATHFIEQDYHDSRHQGAISSKVWISNDVPLGGMVKCVRLHPGVTNILEFVGAGNAK